MDKLSNAERKNYNRRHGIPRETKVIRDVVAPHPKKQGGTRGYPKWFRIDAIKLKELGIAPKHLHRSIRRWKNERIDAYEPTGNKAQRGMTGHHRLLLALFKKMHPHASNNACAVFIACHSEDNAVFTSSEVSKAIVDMDLTRKVGSTTAYDAFTPRNLYLHHRFHHYPFPAGIKGTTRESKIDVDECSFELKDANINFGHAVRGMRVRKVGNYGRTAPKLSLILGVEPGDPNLPAEEEGSIEKPRLYYRLSTDAGTTVENYVDFLNIDLMDQFRPNEPKRVIMHGNLTSHKADEVVDAIYNRGHTVICRPPYRPHEAPIEYVFDMVACEVRKRWQSIKDMKDLNEEILKILDGREGLGGFNELFAKLNL